MTWGNDCSPAAPALTIAQFRADFPEFADTTAYPDSVITFWLNQGVRQLNVTRWADQYNTGLELFIAHNITLSAQRVQDAQNGDAPGASGAISSMRVDKVAISFNTQIGAIEGAGAYNSTTYGVMFYQLLLMAGAGGMQLTGEGAPDEYLYGTGYGWPGSGGFGW